MAVIVSSDIPCLLVYMNVIDIPTNFKVIGFGKNIGSVALDTLRSLGYYAVCIVDANECQEILPTDDDKMAFILVTGDEENAANCAKTFYQAGVLTIAITCDDITLPKDCCDTQTHVHDKGLVPASVSLIDIIFNANGYISLDFNDLQTCLKDSRNLAITNLQGTGGSRVEEALSQIKEKLPNLDLNTVENIIIAVYFDQNSGHPLEMSEMSGITNYISALPEDVYAIYGLYNHKVTAPNGIDVVLIMSGKELQV